MANAPWFRGRAPRVALAIALVALAALAVRRSEFARHAGSVGELRAWVARHHPWDQLAYVAAYCAAAAAGLPGVLVSFVGATLFGMAKGTALTLVAGNLAAWPPYLLARWAARPVGPEPRESRLAAFAARHGFNGVFVLRLVPVPYNLVNFICGAARCRPGHYFWGTLLGMVPGTMVYQCLFAQWGAELLDRGFRWRMLAEPALLAPLALYVGFVLFALWMSRRLLRMAPAAVNGNSGA